MPATEIIQHLPAPEDTDRLGESLARICNPGDCILLNGQTGAGKSALARAFIRAQLGEHTDVPSPTFTLIQTYETKRFEILHADLYRLSDTSEAMELGLLDAFEDQVCIIEWPDILGDLAPPTALTITLSVDGDGRRAVLTGDASWRVRLKRAFQDA